MMINQIKKMLTLLLYDPEHREFVNGRGPGLKRKLKSLRHKKPELDYEEFKDRAFMVDTIQDPVTGEITLERVESYIHEFRPQWNYLILETHKATCECLEFLLRPSWALPIRSYYIDDLYRPELRKLMIFYDLNCRGH